MQTSVLIVGGGPVGLALACELGLAGVDCLMIEKRDGSITVPKMSSISAGGMELCRRWGIASEVRNAVWSETHALDFVYVESMRGRELARQKVPSYATRQISWTPEGWAHCPQLWFDPILARRVGRLQHVIRRYDTALDSFEQDAEGVTATIITPEGRRETVRAAYLVGCDGPGGVVRPALGIGLTGLGKLAASVNIFFRSAQLPHLHAHGWARFYRPIDETGCWAELIPIDGRELFRLTVFDDARAAGDPDLMLRRVFGGPFPYEIISTLPWERRDYVAESYGRGRVLIAGDAAHQYSPTGGIGMHTGLEDAVNLAWKLAATLQGWGGAGLLPSYESERRPIGERNAALSTSTYKALVVIPPHGVDRPGESWRADMTAYSVPDQLRTNFTYDGSPLLVPDGTPLPDGYGKRLVVSARPGARLPHAWLADGRSTLDLVGCGVFTLLRIGPAAPAVETLVAAAQLRGLPMQVVDVADAPVLDVCGQPLVLVRPDLHIAWRGRACPSEPLAVIDRVRGAGRREP